MNEYTRYCAQINSLSDQVNELKKDKIDKDSKINNLNKDIENLKKDKIDKEAQINNLKTQVDNLNTQVDNLNKDNIDKDKKISELNKDKKAQEDKISNLQKKVDYMEVILNSLISRKVIKHCINQIINKYKSSIKMIKKTKTEANGEINEFFYIQVINNINSVSVKQSQDLYL